MVVSSHDLFEQSSIPFYKRGGSDSIDLPRMLPFRSIGTSACRCVKNVLNAKTTSIREKPPCTYRYKGSLRK